MSREGLARRAQDQRDENSRRIVVGPDPHPLELRRLQPRHHRLRHQRSPPRRLVGARAALHRSRRTSKRSTSSPRPPAKIPTSPTSTSSSCAIPTPFLTQPTGTDALNPILKDGHLHGCGACDVKAVLACLLAIVSRRASQQWPDGLRLVLTAEEEIGCIGAAHLFTAGALRPRRMVIGEPTQLHPARAGKGYCLAEVTVHGKEAHSAHPQQGISAIYNAARLIAAIEDLAQQLSAHTHPFFNPGFTTINIGTIEGGTAKNIVPGECRFQLEWRPIPTEPAHARARLRRADHRPSAPRGSRFPCRYRASAPAIRIRDPRRRAAGPQHRNASPANPPPRSRLAPRPASLRPSPKKSIVFGPGDMRTAHSSRECVPLAELDAAVACLDSLMSDVLSTEQRPRLSEPACRRLILCLDRQSRHGVDARSMPGCGAHLKSGAVAAGILGNVERGIRAAKHFADRGRIFFGPERRDADAARQPDPAVADLEGPRANRFQQIIDAARSQRRDPIPETG